MRMSCSSSHLTCLLVEECWTGVATSQSSMETFWGLLKEEGRLFSKVLWDKVWSAVDAFMYLRYFFAFVAVGWSWEWKWSVVIFHLFSFCK